MKILPSILSKMGKKKGKGTSLDTKKKLLNVTHEIDTSFLLSFFFS